MTTSPNLNETSAKSDPSNALPADVDAMLVACIALIGLIGSFLLGATAILQGRIVVGAAILIIAITIAGNFFIATRTYVSYRQLHISLTVIAMAMLVTVFLSGEPNPSSVILFALIPFIMAALSTWRGMLVWLTINMLILGLVYFHAPYAASHYTEPAPSYALHYYMILSVLSLFISATAYVLIGRRHAHANQLGDINNSLRNAQRLAKNANDAKGHFLGRLSHELRTPLNAIIGFSDVAARDRAAPLTPDQQQKLKHIQLSGQLLLEIVDEILEISKHDQRSGFMVLLPVALPPVINDAIDAARNGIQARNLTVNVNFDRQTGLQVLADKKMLAQIVDELLANAIDYNRPGGLIDIDIDIDDTYARINVTDTGIGIATTALGELFEPFSRMEASPQRHRGSGLGLTLARSLAERMNGKIEVQSQPDRGSTFTIVLPIYKGPVPHTTTATDDRPASPEIMEISATIADQSLPDILYVEDNQLNQLVMGAMFDELGIARLHLAWDATEGLTRAQTIKPAVLLLDIHLPDFDGMELLARIRAIEDLKSIPAIAVSADAIPTHIEAALAAGFDGYLTKPVGLDALRTSLEKYLHTRQKRNPS